MLHPIRQFVFLLSLVSIVQFQWCCALALSSASISSVANTNDGNVKPPYLFPNSIPVSDRDVLTLQRQTGQIAPSKAAVSIPACCRCRHGFPQAFAMDPVPPLPPLSSSSSKSAGSGYKKRRINSGLLKLSCPLLVRAVDQLEDDGMIQFYNARLTYHEETHDDGNDDTNENDAGSVNLLRESIRDSHAAHATARSNIILHRPTDTDDNHDGTTTLSYVQETLGPRGSRAFLDAGVAGASALPVGDTSDIDVKCLHAWLADYLFRGEDRSVLGGMVADRLVEASELELGGVAGGGCGGIAGTVGCHVLCNPESGGLAEPPKPRNKQRLKARKEKERRKRRHEQGKLGP